MTQLPPYASLLNLRVEAGAHGPLIVMPFGDDVVGRPGFLHGGAIAGLLEFAAFTTLARALGDPLVADDLLTPARSSPRTRAGTVSSARSGN